MKNMIFDEMPHTHEVVIDEENPTFYFSLHPRLNEFVFELLSGTNMYVEYFEKELGLSAFIKPNDKVWGYGKILVRSEKYTENGWITWACKIPKKPRFQKLDEISATLHDLTVAISLFESDNLEFGAKQFFTLDCVTVKSHDHLNGGSFNFTYSRDVLNFTSTIWGEHWTDSPKYMAIINCMEKVYAHLTSKRDARISKCDFYVGQYHGKPCWPTFRVPGSCACISPDHFTDTEDRGARYSPHNIDTKAQQLSLLAGIVKLANMAREQQKV